MSANANLGAGAEHIPEHPQARGITVARERIGARGRPQKSALLGVHAAESLSAQRAICPLVANYRGRERRGKSHKNFAGQKSNPRTLVCF